MSARPPRTPFHCVLIIAFFAVFFVIGCLEAAHAVTWWQRTAAILLMLITLIELVHWFFELITTER